MSRILITGVAGFIASTTAARLLADGHQIVGIDNLCDTYDVRLKRARLDALLPSAQFSFHQVDVEDFASVRALFDRHPFDAVMHLAGRCGVRTSMDNPRLYVASNTVGTLHVLEAMRRTEVRKLVFSSTSSLYAGQPTPFVETLPVNTPISPYAASKKAAEMLTFTYHRLFGLDVTVLRYFTVYGPAGRPDMSPFRFIRWIDEGQPIELFGDGTQRRDFTYVDDIAAGTVAAMKPLGYEIINLGGGRRMWTLNEMISLMEERLGRTAKIERRPVHQTDMTETLADVSKAARVLGWHPTIDLPEGLDRTVRWYRENRDWARTIQL